MERFRATEGTLNTLNFKKKDLYMLVIEISFRHVYNNFCNVAGNYMLMGLKALC